MLLVAVNRAAAFNVAARWILHDLRSPAQALTLMADLLGEPTEDLEPVLRGACGNLARSLDLLARVLHPRLSGEVGPIALQEPIAFVADLHRACRSHARLELAVDAGLPAAAGSAGHLEHALLNLILYITNALRPGGTGTIRISARPEGDRVAIAVAWDGPPVARELETRLFALPPDLTTVGEPLAIGLPVAHEVVRLSGGTLRYAPDPGAGPSFLMSLPQWRQDAPARPVEPR